MTEVILTPKQLDVSKITYGAVRTNDKTKTKSVYMLYDKKKIRLQLPKMHAAPYGLGNWKNPDGSVKWSLDLSFKGIEDKQNIKEFFDMLQALDDKLVSDGVANSFKWLGKEQNSKEVVKALYTPHIRYSKDKTTGKIKDYPPTFKLNLPKRDDKFIAEVYDHEGNEIDLAETETKNAQIIAQVECQGIWSAAGRFGYTWRVVRMRITPPVSSRGASSFIDIPEDNIEEDIVEEDDEDVEHDDMNNIVVPTSEVPAADNLVESSVEDGNEEDEEEDDDDELEQPPPPPVVVKRSVKKTSAARK